MKVVLNPNEEVVAAVRDGLKRTGGYCPCRLQQSEDTKCRCLEFREQIEDPTYEGFCHCFLFYKSLADDADTANADALAAAVALGYKPKAED